VSWLLELTAGSCVTGAADAAKEKPIAAMAAMTVCPIFINSLPLIANEGQKPCEIRIRAKLTAAPLLLKSNVALCAQA